MNSKQVNEGTTTYTVEEPTPQVIAVADAIFKTMQELDVKPQDVLPVLGEAVIRFLVPLASPLGYEKEKIIKVFGEGLTNAVLEFNE